VTNAARLFRSYFAAGTLSVRTHDCEAGSGIGIRQEVAFSLPRLLAEIIRLQVTLLDQDRQKKSGENYGTQNSGCKQPSIAIESFDNVIGVG
jgi:hypothetical protein